jgi:transcriptional regulator with XRE-family HTH domain
MAVDICARVGRRIRVLRKEMGLNQEQLASKAEIARDSLSKLESGKREMGLYVLGRIVKAFGLTLEEFFRGM